MNKEKKTNKLKEYTKKFLAFLGKGLMVGRWEIKIEWKF